MTPSDMDVRLPPQLVRARPRVFPVPGDPMRRRVVRVLRCRDVGHPPMVTAVMSHTAAGGCCFRTHRRQSSELLSSFIL
jgi:hypothetical protein